ncbi:hypothetical protein KBB48_01030 [Candidatus Shapirobacteria bacterium]|nr:hypothetical protein [Candidatus Shapirobacteria bacterium]
MSLKATKNIKKFPSEQSEQLDLVETINEDNHLQKKRLSIIVVLFLTVGISLCFWIYRQAKSVDFKNINLPHLSIKLPQMSSPKFSYSVPENWSLYIQSVGNTSFSHSFNFNPNTDFATIKTDNPAPFAKKYLPAGVTVTEKTNTTTDYFEIYSTLSSPKIKFNLYVKIPGGIDTSSPEINQYARLTESVYWYLIALPE